MLFYIWKQGALGLFDKPVRCLVLGIRNGLGFVVGICKQGGCSVTAQILNLTWTRWHIWWMERKHNRRYPFFFIQPWALAR